ncbi:hypothetical protein BU16DRAFT_539016 [Lophium mytilinum]|uniref:Uncharacterized protein n=1 Tax=Lophium mytilinum TaxID=390894 RepID=A0A6A6QVR4_9PEZI|nr:hypothetical protein BU16DRAFT_539016 [Lophium mytilinum]
MFFATRRNISPRKSTSLQLTTTTEHPTASYSTGSSFQMTTTTSTVDGQTELPGAAQRDSATRSIYRVPVGEPATDTLFSNTFQPEDGVELPRVTLATDGESLKRLYNRLMTDQSPENCMSYLMLSVASDIASAGDSMRYVEVQAYIAKWMLPKLSTIELVYFAAINNFNDLLVAVLAKLEDEDEEAVALGEMLVFVMKFGDYWQKHNFMNAYREYNGIEAIGGNVRAQSRNENTGNEGSESQEGNEI